MIIDGADLTVADDSEYCVLPLTTDIPGAVNPFRRDRQKSQLSGLLVHAILALCCHHRRGVAGISSNAAEHRRKAVELLESAFKNRPIIGLLDPILILFTLEVSNLPPRTTTPCSNVWPSVRSPLPEHG